MTTIQWSILEKIYYFIICPIYDYLLPKSNEEAEREMQKAMLKILARDHPYVTVGDPRYRFNRKKDGEDINRP